jgi:hypothetical protein
MIPVESTNIKEAGYDVETMTMFIRFHSGQLFSYTPISQPAWIQFMKAESKGKFFAANIRNNPIIKATLINKIEEHGKSK